MQQHVYLDLETYSSCDLRRGGASRYARHIDTDVMCMAWCVDQGPMHLWLPTTPPPLDFLAALKRGARVVAHNAAFEWELWNFVLAPTYGFPRVPVDRWVCTAAQAGFANLPRSLEKCAAALKLSAKDMAGRRVMVWLSKPQRKKRRMEPEKVDVLLNYCVNDVEVERQIHHTLPPLPPDEAEMWRIDRSINHRGVPVDLQLCRGAVQLLRAHAAGINVEAHELTEGRVSKVSQRDKLLAELRRYDPFLPDIRADTLKAWKFDDPAAQRLAWLRQQAGLASVKKMKATLDWADADGRCRNTTYYYAAGPGRWGGRGPQLQNMKRAAPATPDAIQAISAGDYAAAEKLAENGNVTGLIGQSTRAIVCAPPGRTLVQSDFAAIEARVLVWIAGEEDTLHKFAAGVDLYKDMACKIYGLPSPESVNKEQRQIGKVAILGLGYQCGAAKFHTMATKAGASLTEPFADMVVDVYRSTHPHIVGLWRNLEQSAVLCVQRRKPVACRNVVFNWRGDWLTIRLPSGRELYYYQPEVREGKFGRPTFYYRSQKGVLNAYGGMLTENIVQGAARDLLAHALKLLERAGCMTVLHVHDSVMVEADEHDMAAQETVHRIMETAPAWAERLPLKAETITSRRMK